MRRNWVEETFENGQGGCDGYLQATYSSCHAYNKLCLNWRLCEHLFLLIIIFKALCILIDKNKSLECDGHSGTNGRMDGGSLAKRKQKNPVEAGKECKKYEEDIIEGNWWGRLKIYFLDWHMYS